LETTLPQYGRLVKAPAFLDACALWYSGAFLLETVPTALHILMRHANDPEEAILRAVNDTKDNDSIGAIVGAAVGALHGEEGLPDRWKRGLLGRTQKSDDGRIFEIMDDAIQLFGQVV
jgi:ADP-ribosyl-[dinitrogen reductase] hydrolase